VKQATAYSAGKKGDIVMAEEEKLNEEAKLAQEATPPETPAEEPEMTSLKQQLIAKDAVIGDYRRRERDTRRELVEERAQKVAPPPKSPLELAREQTPADEAVEFTPELYEAQRKFEQGQATALSEQEIYERQRLDYEAGLLSFPERDALVAEGGHLLTDGDKRNIWDAGKNSGQELKRILNHRIEQNQPKEKTEKTDKSKAEEKAAKEKAAKEEAAKEETPSQDEILADKKLDEKFKSLTFAK